jgi:GT2 family glycosyltransferase
MISSLDSCQSVLKPVIHIVTVNYNHAEDTLACIETIRAQVGVSTRLLVVDNGSQDDSITHLQHSAPDVELICTGKNLGFAGGFNIGMQLCLERGAEQVMIINNDTLANPDMLLEMQKALCGDVDAVAPVIYYADHQDQIWSQGGRIVWLLLEVIDNHGRGAPIPATPADRDFLSGCCILIRREALQRVGLLDERYFLYYEDLDWSVRFHKAGLKGQVIPNAKLLHKVSRSSGGSDSPNERYWHARSSILYFRKHVHGWNWLVIFPWRLASALRISLRLILSQKWPSLIAYWRGILDGLNAHPGQRNP